MNVPRKHIVVITVVAGILLLSFGKRNRQFVVPKGWPKPAYNFKNNPLTEDGTRLGRTLFFDPILSRDSTISCASCHAQYTGFTHSDHNLSHGIDGLKGTRNSSTLINLAWSTSFMWDIKSSPTLAPELTNKIALTKKERLDIIYFLRTLTDYELLNNERFKYSAE